MIADALAAADTFPFLHFIYDRSGEVQESAVLERKRGKPAGTTSDAIREDGSAWVHRALESLGEIAALPENWDGEGGPPVDRCLLVVAQRLLERLRGNVEFDVPPPEVSPIQGGAFQLEWQVRKRYLEFEFSHSQKLLFLTDEDTPRGAIITSGECPLELADKARELLSWLMGRPPT